MSRPRKYRRVCGLPLSDSFGPLNGRGKHKYFLIMTVDEYETIRLIDFEGLTQDQCAKQMNIGRTTVQGIYSQARSIIAKSLVEGKPIRIEGGDYKLCNGFTKSCMGAGCKHRFGKNKNLEESE
ncbi:MAG TPA: DUF134 domain-containing protein [Eubacteriaceae bacterium]|nr:DUF134 domain-containing protein [Eubacteriaceae bacterium]